MPHSVTQCTISCYTPCYFQVTQCAISCYTQCYFQLHSVLLSVTHHAISCYTVFYFLLHTCYFQSHSVLFTVTHHAISCYTKAYEPLHYNSQFPLECLLIRWPQHCLVLVLRLLLDVTTTATTSNEMQTRHEKDYSHSLKCTNYVRHSIST